MNDHPHAAAPDPPGRGRQQQAAIRVGDQERAAAMDQLGQHFAAGRLTISEYEDRCAKAADVRYQHDLALLFADLPSTAATVSTNQLQMYSADEIEAFRRKGSRPREAIMGLTVIGTVALSLFASETVLAVLLLLLIIPAVAVLLYVLKIGPDSWHVPSPQQLERQRSRQLNQLHRYELQQRKAERKLQQEELKNSAVNQVRRLMGGTDR